MIIASVNGAGRGSLAGPVAAALSGRHALESAWGELVLIHTSLRAPVVQIDEQAVSY